VGKGDQRHDSPVVDELDGDLALVVEPIRGLKASEADGPGLNQGVCGVDGALVSGQLPDRHDREFGHLGRETLAKPACASQSSIEELSSIVDELVASGVDAEQQQR
jgi:hypothetical protein